VDFSHVRNFFDWLLNSNEFLAISVLVLGFVAALVVRMILARLSQRFSSRIDVYSSSFETALNRAGPLLFWTILIVSVFWAYEILGIYGEWRVLESLLDQAPKIVLAVAIVIVAHLVGTALRDVVRRTIRDDRFTRPTGSMAYVAVLLIGLIVGLQPVGINIGFIGVGVLIIVGVTLATFGLAFAIGAQHHIANLIARQELNKLNVGDRVRIDDIEGTVADIQRTKVILITSEGTASVPASRFAQSIVQVLTNSQ
jgi:hypothetical protein